MENVNIKLPLSLCHTKADLQIKYHSKFRRLIYNNYIETKTKYQ